MADRNNGNGIYVPNANIHVGAKPIMTWVVKPKSEPSPLFPSAELSAQQRWFVPLERHGLFPYLSQLSLSFK
jgi:hypothetical protein